MTRTELLRKNTIESVHKQARVYMPVDWSTKDMDVSLAERKAYAIKKVLDEMPLYIGEKELIVGSRTMYGYSGEDTDDKSLFDYVALPSYINKKDEEYFGFNHEYATKSHYTPDFSILLTEGIDGIISDCENSIKQHELEEKKSYLNSVMIAYRGLSNLISRYAVYAKDLANKEQDLERKAELETISKCCENISHKPASNFMESCQLFWFGYLSVLIENFQFINFGRVDQVLYEFYDNEDKELAQQIVECLLLKMYDQVDLKLLDKNLMGTYAAQHNITIGGYKRDGSDGTNELTRAFLIGLSKTRLPEPLVSIRTNKNSPDWLWELSNNLTVSGMNCFAYYNDDMYIKSKTSVGLDVEDARDYAFGLCQDVVIPGREDTYCSGGVDLTFMLLKTLDECKDDITFDDFVSAYKDNIAEEIDIMLTQYNNWEEAIREYNEGRRSMFFERFKSGELQVDQCARGLSLAQSAVRHKDGKSDPRQCGQSIMSPLPFTSSMYHGCIDRGVDITRCGCDLTNKGVMILNLIIAINSLAAIRKVVFDDNYAKLSDVKKACDADYEGYEELRQRLWNAPKWANDDDYVDIPGRDIIEFAASTIMKYKTPGGGRHYSGLHQPHPVFAGRLVPATPEGRHAGTPIPVTISPENGTVKNGPLASFRSVLKIDPMMYQWNVNCMLQYSLSTLGGKEGGKNFGHMLKTFFEMGGVQHQPNVVDIKVLKKAQADPADYKDLIIRMWGVSAHFVDLPRDVQDEFIARYDGLE